MNSSIKFVVAMMAIAVLGFQSLHADDTEVVTRVREAAADARKSIETAKSKLGNAALAAKEADEGFRAAGVRLEVARNAYMRDSSEAKTAGDMAVEAARQRDAARSEVARLETAGGTLTVREAYVAGLLRALELASAAVEAAADSEKATAEEKLAEAKVAFEKGGNALKEMQQALKRVDKAEKTLLNADASAQKLLQSARAATDKMQGAQEEANRLDGVRKNAAKALKQAQDALVSTVAKANGALYDEYMYRELVSVKDDVSKAIAAAGTAAQAAGNAATAADEAKKEAEKKADKPTPASLLKEAKEKAALVARIEKVEKKVQWLKEAVDGLKNVALTDRQKELTQELLTNFDKLSPEQKERFFLWAKKVEAEPAKADAKWILHPTWAKNSCGEWVVIGQTYVASK